MIKKLFAASRCRIAMVFAACCAMVATCFLALPAISSAATGPSFRVLAFYNGNWDAAHIDFDKEANAWFPQAATQHGFAWESTTDWNRLNDSELARFDVVMFLDGAPPASARPAFQRYMNNGGAWFGLHVSAYTDEAADWSWYYNTFLGSGNFVSNTWGPTAVRLKIDDREHPTTRGLDPTITSSVAEWYSWSGNLRTNPSIDVLASIDQSSFPVGTDPTQTWYSGDYPIMWSNRNYHMVYANFGHNAMDYASNTRLSSTFASPAQNQFVINSLLWLGGAADTPSPSPTASPSDGQLSPTAWYTMTSQDNGLCVDVRGAASANGTSVQQYPCNGTTAQQFQFQPTSGGYVRINSRVKSTQVIDVTDVSSADGAPLQLWSYSDGDNQQWSPVAEPSGAYHFVSRHSGKCLSQPGGTAAASVQLEQRSCNGSGSQSFQLTATA